MVRVVVLVMFCAFSLVLPIHSSGKSSFTIPPLPIEEKDKVAIVVTNNPLNINQIKSLLQPYKNVKLRQIYEHAIFGFSVKGNPEEIQKLTGHHQVHLVSDLQNYKVDTLNQSSIPFIGATDIRGFYDRNDKRLTGKGITVGVIDTGVDYSHPDLHRNYRGGSDLISGDTDPMETKGLGALNTLHGTHVAGVIAANGKMQGVAPDATIRAYRALGPGGSGTSEQVLAAIEAAIKDKVDIINLSLGNSINGPDLPISIALNNAVEKGIVAVTSSGNSGPNLWTVGAPGTASKAISVGASSPPLEIPYISGVLAEDIRMEPLVGSILWNIDRPYELAYGGLGKKNQLKKVKGKIAIIKRGELTFTEKVKNAKEAGAVGVILFNNTKGAFIGNIEEPITIPIAAISKQNGEKITKKLKQEKVITRIMTKLEQDQLAPFSSRGPVTHTWEVKPDILAPGVAIQSTVPNGYIALQGTSMAAPHIAGACALIKQAHPEWSPEQIKAALMNNAKPLKGDKKLYHTFEQGAGRVQIVNAVQADSLIYPSSIHFGSFQQQHEERKMRLTIENTSDQIQSYSFNLPHQKNGVTWELPIKFSLNAKEKKVIMIKAVIDHPTENKMYDGFITLNAGSKRYDIPYLIVTGEPEYPRIMGFELVPGDDESTLRYEVYLPGGADEFAIALFDPESYQFIGFLDWKRNVNRGMIEQVVKKDILNGKTSFIMKVIATKAGKTDELDAELNLNSVVKTY